MQILDVKEVVWGGLDVVWGGLGLAWQVNIIKKFFKFLLQLLILSQKHTLGVKKVVWDDLEVVWGVFGVVWGYFHGPWQVVSFHEKNISFRG